MKCFLKCAGAFFMYTGVLAIVFSVLFVVVIGLLVLAEYITNLLGLNPVATTFIYLMEIAMIIAAATIISDRKKICGKKGDYENERDSYF